MGVISNSLVYDSLSQTKLKILFQSKFNSPPFPGLRTLDYYCAYHLFHRILNKKSFFMSGFNSLESKVTFVQIVIFWIRSLVC